MFSIVTTPTELTRLPKLTDNWKTSKQISETRHSEHFCDYLPGNAALRLTFVFNHQIDYFVALSLLEKHRVAIMFSEYHPKLVKYIDRNKVA